MTEKKQRKAKPCHSTSMSHQILDSGMPITLSRFKIVLVADRVLCGPIRITDNPYKCLRLRLGEVGQIFQRVILDPDSEVGGWTDIMVGWTDASRFQVRIRGSPVHVAQVQVRTRLLVRGEKFWSAVQTFKFSNLVHGIFFVLQLTYNFLLMLNAHVCRST